jgi:hypothetical protein
MDKGLNLFQLLILGGGKIPETLPPRIAENIASVKATYPRARHHLLSGDEVRNFIHGNFSPEVLAAYDLLKPYAFKADLARYCLLYLHGGLYVDVGICLYHSLEMPVDKGIVFFRDITSSSHTSWAVSNGLLRAKPRREEFKLAIDLIVKNCRERHYGLNPLFPTGPVLLGRVFAMIYKPEDYLCGEVRYLPPDYSEKSIGFVSPDSKIIAKRLKPNGGSYLGLAGANDYCEMWLRKQVYGE